MPTSIDLRLPGDAAGPTLVYLPGLHGDWTLLGGFRRQLAGRVRLVEARYPRTTAASLEDYAAAMDSALAARGVTRGWLLAESFGSQVAWALLARPRHFQTVGLVLAGGFVRYPWRTAVRGCRGLFGRLPAAWLVGSMRAYARGLRWRLGRDADAAELEEFVQRRTEADRAAAIHRLRLIEAADPREVARRVTLPVFHLTAGIDVIVPWPPVRHWLRRHCPGYRATRVLTSADHNVLGGSPRRAAARIIEWMAVPMPAGSLDQGAGGEPVPIA